MNLSLKRIVLLIIALYIVLAYILLPYLWHYYFEDQNELYSYSLRTHTKQGIPGGPINISMIGSRDELIDAMHAAGWHLAKPITITSSLGIISSVLFNLSDKNAPVSPLYFDGRPEDLAFEKLVGLSAAQRHHVRFWFVPNNDNKQWFGSATFDQGVEFSRYTGQITHQIASNVDAERDYLVNDLASIGVVKIPYGIKKVEPVHAGYNGEGNFFYTDGKIIILEFMSKPSMQGSTN